MRKPWGAAVAAVLLVASSAHAEGLAEVGGAAPLFRLPRYGTNAAAGPLGLEQLVGPDATDKSTRLVLLSFMASYCGPCAKELPYLESLHERYQQRGLKVVLVSIDTEPEGQKKVEAMIATHHVSFPVLKDRFNVVARRWLGPKSPLPSVFLVRPDGTIPSAHRGYDLEVGAMLDKELAAALGAKP